MGRKRLKEGKAEKLKEIDRRKFREGIQPFSPSAIQSFPSDDRQALAALEAAGADDLAATAGAHAGTITNLTGAFLAVRAECGLHDLLKKKRVRGA